MDKLKGMAKDLIHGDNADAPAAGAANVDENELASLQKFAGTFGSLDVNGDGKVDFHDLQARMSGQTGNPAAAEQEKAGASSAVSKLMHMYKQETGNPFSGGTAQFALLSQLATSKTGIPFSSTMLEKMVSWKTGGLL